MKKNVGMIGIGMMGHGIASNVIKKGWPLAVLEHPGNQPLDALKAAGARTFQRRFKEATGLAPFVDRPAGKLSGDRKCERCHQRLSMSGKR